MRWDKICKAFGWTIEPAISYWIKNTDNDILGGGNTKLDAFVAALTEVVRKERMCAYLDGFLDGQVKKDADQAWIESDTRNEAYNLLHKAQCFRTYQGQTSEDIRIKLLGKLRKDRVVRGVREADAEQDDTRGV